MKTKNNLIVILLAVLFLNGCASNPKKGQEPLNSAIFETRKEEASYIQAYNKALALWPIPYEEVDVKTSFGIAHVIVSGPENGDPLVLLHGMNASSTMWYPNVKAFSEKHRVYAIDFILEPGKSISKEEIKDKDEIYIWYNEVFNHFNLKKISLIGASRGGWIALLLALHPADRIKNIILLSPAQAFTFIEIKEATLTNVLFFLSPKRKRLRKSFQSFSCNVDKIKQPFINEYYRATKYAKKNSSILQMRPFSDEELQSLSMPVLLLIGQNDIINDKESLEKAKKLIPTVETDIIPGAGHFLSFDQAEIVNKKIIDFLNKDK